MVSQFVDLAVAHGSPPYKAAKSVAEQGSVVKVKVHAEKSNPASSCTKLTLERIRQSKELVAQQREHPTQTVQKEREKMKRQERAKRESLYEILIMASGRLTPEDLFRRAGFTKDAVDEFYEELRTAIKCGQVKQLRPNDADVYLEGVKS